MHREPGPHPVVRAVVGLALGAALGAVVALLLPRSRRESEPEPPTAAPPPT